MRASAAITAAKSPQAARALELVSELQGHFAHSLETMVSTLAPDGEACNFVEHSWRRDEGRHGGGWRREAPQGSVFNRASINVSQVHYDDEASKRLSSATALSAIVHPDHPRAPSMHMHISWTEMRESPGYWRIMADLNPAIEDPAASERFRQCIRSAAGEFFAEGEARGHRYFQIPALGRARGVVHFYLENHRGSSLDDELRYGRGIGRAVIDEYVDIVRRALETSQPATGGERARQLSYHTLYLYQVLTLDRGTTAGLLIHDQNDVGIMGSLPAFVDRVCLAGWAESTPEPVRQLVLQLVDALPDAHPCPVDAAVKQRLAAVVRDFHRAHPEALALQATGDEQVPTTVDNHR